MVHFVQQYSNVLEDNGKRYVARMYAGPRPNGLWDGWFVFLPLDEGRELATGCETTQSSLAYVKYWAEAISSVYLQGALKRARASTPEAALGRRAQRVEREEALAKAAAAAHAQAAAAARAAALKARHDRRDAEKQLLAERAAAARAAAALQAKAAAAARTEQAAAEKAEKHQRDFMRRRTGGTHDMRPAAAPENGHAHPPRSSHRRRV